MARARHRLGVVALFAVLLGIGIGRTSRAAAQSPFELDLRIDLPVLGLGLAGSSMALIEADPPACFPSCDASRINALDRTALGFYSQGARTAADILVFSAVGLPLLLNALDSGGNGYAEDTVVYAEALLLTQALVQLTKHGVRRRAPLVYDPDSPRDAVTSRDAGRSFISGHTATAFASTTAYSVTYFLRHPDSPARFAVLGTGLALSIGIGILKVLAGYHFWTDIAAGALVGTSVGALTPFLHLRD
jgi:membrane-associated phospholipid phosphatase